LTRWLDFKDDVDYQGRADGQALHAIDQPDVPGLRPEDFDKQV
jgi:hypothetical protein